MRQFIATRTEALSHNTDWEKSWRLARLKGLGPDHTSFLLKLCHKILLTKERKNRTSPTTSPTCVALGCSGEEVETLEHALVHCQANKEVGRALMTTLRLSQPTLSVEAALRLELDVPEADELPLVWLISATLFHFWEQRQ